MKEYAVQFSKSRGVTLLENLIALLVLSIGLLGIAGLQASTFRNGKDATFRAIATQQAENMANRMRANPAGVAADLYNNIDGATAMPTGAALCAGTTCTAAQIATLDMAEWDRDNDLFLPGGRGKATVCASGVACASTVTPALTIVDAVNPALTPRLFTVTVRWDGNRSGATGLGCNPGTATDLKCVTLQVVGP